MSIHQTIYDTLNLTDEAVVDLIGAGDVQSVIRRREQLRQFLEGNEWDEAAYKLWLRSNNAPSLGRRAQNLGKALVQVGTSDKPVFELVGEAKRRMDICKSNTCGMAKKTKVPYIGEILFCQHIECGCFMGLKTKLAAMSCPENLW